jgi:hypothetical protein
MGYCWVLVHPGRLPVHEGKIQSARNDVRPSSSRGCPKRRLGRGDIGVLGEYENQTGQQTEYLIYTRGRRHPSAPNNVSGSGRGYCKQEPSAVLHTRRQEECGARKSSGRCAERVQRLVSASTIDARGMPLLLQAQNNRWKWAQQSRCRVDLGCGKGRISIWPSVAFARWGLTTAAVWVEHEKIVCGCCFPRCLVGHAWDGSPRSEDRPWTLG